MAKVSVIMPVRNGRDTMVGAVMALLKQTLQDIEIIIVNDASTDDTWGRILAFEQMYPDKIIAVNSDVQMGAGGARNIGIESASGEYIGFCDSDDEPSIEMYEKLYDKAIEGDFDFVDCGYFDKGRESTVINTPDKYTGELDSEKRSGLIIQGGYIWSKIFKRELIISTGIPFRERAILEDADFLDFIFATAKRAGNVNEVLYYYEKSDGSLSSEEDVRKYTGSIIDAMKAIYGRVSKLDSYRKIQNAVEFENLKLYSYGINCAVRGYLDKKVAHEEALEYLRELRRTKLDVIKKNQNPYIKGRIENSSLRLMEANDKSPERLLNDVVRL